MAQVAALKKELEQAQVRGDLRFGIRGLGLRGRGFRTCWRASKPGAQGF